MKRLLLAFVMLTLGSTLARAEAWHTTRGEVEGKLVAFYEPFVVLARSQGSAILPVNELSDADLPRVAEFLAKRPPRTKWKDSNSKLANALIGHLDILGDKHLVSYDPGDRLEPEFYLIYFGAGWCGPCREFSPQFVKSYTELRKTAGERFEVIFASRDENEGGQIDYAREAHMPWPMIDFRLAREIRPICRWEGDGIPCLVVLTPSGDLLYHTYQGDEFMGPQSALDAFVQFLKATSPSLPAKLAMFKLAKLQRAQAAAGKSLPPKPYLVGLDPRQYQTIETHHLKATLQISERGDVTDATFEPQQSAVIDAALVDDARKWLFLPAIKNGVAVATTAALPVDLGP